MATDLKTIKFGENGEVYAVNDCPVKVSGELTESSEVIDFGSFDGLTDLTVAVKGVAGTSGSYSYVTINGTTSGFTSRWTGIYNGTGGLRIKKLGPVWQVFFINGYGTTDTGVTLSMLDAAESVTSLSIKCYSGTPFAAGTKYYLEGR